MNQPSTSFELHIDVPDDKPTMRTLRKEKLDPRAKTARRLIRLADLLDKVPEENFDMDRWVGFYNEDLECERTADGPEDLIDMTGRFDCGTKACVAGWAGWLWHDELPKMPITGYQASEQRTDTISGMACKVLGFEYTSDWGDQDLFSSSAPWQTTTDAAIECRRRATNILQAMNMEAARRGR